MKTKDKNPNSYSEIERKNDLVEEEIKKLSGETIEDIPSWTSIDYSYEPIPGTQELYNILRFCTVHEKFKTKTMKTKKLTAKEKKDILKEFVDYLNIEYYRDIPKWMIKEFIEKWGIGIHRKMGHSIPKKEVNGV